jgi:hypothetical protein
MSESTPSQRIRLKALNARLAKAGEVLATNVRDAKRLRDITELRASLMGVRHRLSVHREKLKELAEESKAQTKALLALKAAFELEDEGGLGL